MDAFPDVLDLGDELVVRFRAGTPEDHSFIFHSWLHAHFKNGDWPRRWPKWKYMELHDVTIARILEGARVVVACNAERDGQILGYAVADQRALHWVQRKDPYRGKRLGAQLVARALAGTGVVVASHWTKAANHHGHAWGVHFDPFIVRDFEARREDPA
jgi:hypothetical protein